MGVPNAPQDPLLLLIKACSTRNHGARGFYDLGTHTNDRKIIVRLPKKKEFKEEFFWMTERCKARLVAKGYTQQPGIDYFKTYAQVAKFNTLKLIFALAAIHNLHLHHLDINNAFLHGELHEDVDMKLPQGYTPKELVPPNAVVNQGYCIETSGSIMEPSKFCDLFEDSVQIAQDDITFALNPGEVDEPQEANQVLLGKIISRNRLGKAAIQGSLKLSWNAIKGWKWKEIEDGIIQFTFARREDAMNVLARRPWFVCGSLLVIMPWPTWLSPAEVKFDKTPIWVHIESIPPFYWNLSNLKELASKASPVYELPPGIEDAIGMSTLRFRATIDLNKPIFSGFFLRRQRLKDLWLQYKYERLPKVCFKCGLLTHDQSSCFKPPTIIKDASGNFYPMFGIWLKSDAAEKSTFTLPLAKWFQDWVLQKSLCRDPTLRNQMKVQKSIRNGENDEIRECRRQLPSKKRIVTDDDILLGDNQSELVITQLPLVYLPGIGEFAPFGNNSKCVSIQELQEAAEKYAAAMANKKACSSGDQETSNGRPSVLVCSTKEDIPSLVKTTAQEVESHLTVNPMEPLNQSNTSEAGTTSMHMGPKDPITNQTVPPNLYGGSILGTQAQVLQWPSKECWAEPKARELFMGALTVDKFFREPTLFNPIVDIEDFRVQEHLNGPRKRKASDGIVIGPLSRPNPLPTPSKVNNSTEKGSTGQDQTEDIGPYTANTTQALNLEVILNEGSFSPVAKEGGGPPKSNSPLAATSTSFKRGKKAASRLSGKFNSASHWDGRDFELQPRGLGGVKWTGFSFWGYGDLPGKVSKVAMKILAWNCRGLGNTATVRQLTHLVRHHNPDLLILSEVRLSMVRFMRICSKLHFMDQHYFPPTGQSGGLGMCWMKGVMCNVQSSSKYLISVEITSDPPGIPWLLWGLYGPPHCVDKEQFWVQVGDCVLNAQSPILLLGDMNGTLSDSECFNYRGNTSRYAFDFRRMVHRVGLIDLGFQGPRFTWAKGGSNSNGNGGMKRARLDRGLASPDWRILFPNAIINHLAATESDHRPLLMDTMGGIKSKGRQFKYENMWARDPRSFWVVREAWQARRHVNPMLNFHKKVIATCKKLQTWNKTQFRLLSHQIQQAKLNLEEAESKNPDNFEEIDKAKNHLSEALLREEIHWKQKSRVQWLQEGDRCSKFFMASTIIRRRRNYIQCIKDSADGDWLRDQDQIAHCFLTKFKDIFGKCSSGTTPLVEGLFDKMILDHDNDLLNAISKGEEVMAAINDMGKDKARGRAKDSPTTVNDYRPIALCNVAYKIISKILASRIRYLLPRIVSPNQAAFVKGRHIAENTMIAREIVHSMGKRRGKRGFMLIKLDLEKAYDKLDWNFVTSVLLQLGFSNTFTNWVKACISVDEIKLLLNGTTVGKFHPERGLRQGDPLSPSLYIMAAEALSRLFLSKENHGLLKGFKLARNGTPITHLMFADDIILFGEASVREARTLLECLNSYCQFSGQSISYPKSSVFFSRGVSSRKAQVIAETLGMKRMNSRASYLGLPLFRSVKRSEDTQHLVDRVLKRIQGWKVKLLSSAGKTCLIKSVGSSLSNYVASSDVIPVSTATKIDKLLRDFWWGDTEEKRKLHTLAWERLCKPKTAGGLGFRTTETMNKAFLLKWAWKFLTDEDCLWRQLMRDKYSRNQNFLQMEAKASDSILWKAILRMRDDLQRGICRKIGNGNSTSIWFDPWVPGETRQPPPRVESTGGVSLVSNFISDGQWNEDMVRQWFREEDARRILNINLPRVLTNDSWLWLPEPSGNFSVSSAYKLLKNIGSGVEEDKKWRLLWGSKIHNRLKMLWWRILSNCLPTRERLGMSIPLTDLQCPICSCSTESSLHLFWECHFAKAVWFGCMWSLRTTSTSASSWEEWLEWFQHSDNRPANLDLNQFLGGAAIIFDSIWKERNSIIHEGRSTPIEVIIKLINLRLHELVPSCTPRAVEQTCWNPPPEGWVTCNSDVAIGRYHSAGAAVFRDASGTILNVVSFRATNCDPLSGEIAAIHEGAAAAVHFGYRNVVFQSDSLDAVNAIRSNPMETNKLQFNIQDKVANFFILSRSLNLWEVQWIPRSCNCVAHSAAHWANRYNIFGVLDLATFDDFLQQYTADGHVLS
uniref:Reverse transcriptase domain-containing protein n=1 Tax=Cannabis sativa TaxID=3483 RepID=A0A803QHJ4_CANSA